MVHDSRPKTRIRHRRPQSLSRKYRNNGVTRSPPQVNKFEQDDDGERRPRPERLSGRVPRVRAPERFGPSAAILCTMLRSRTHGTTPHSLHGHPFLITRSHARTRDLAERIYGGGVISGHTDTHTVTLTHTHTRVKQFVCASLLVEPNLTSSTLHTTTTAAVNIRTTQIPRH